MVSKPVRVIVTGGTFDKAYDAIKDKALGIFQDV
jgi:hypothetical protein